jgi:hypothetical protein
MSWPTRIAAVLALVLAVLAVGWRVHVNADAAGYARAQGEQTTAALAATEKRRLDERALSIKNQEVTNEYIAEKNRRAAVDADIDQRLLEYEAAANRAASADTPTSAGADGPFEGIAMECVRAFAVLDKAHRDVAAVASGLQSYAGRVCVAPP